MFKENVKLHSCHLSLILTIFENIVHTQVLHIMKWIAIKCELISCNGCMVCSVVCIAACMDRPFKFRKYENFKFHFEIDTSKTVFFCWFSWIFKNNLTEWIWICHYLAKAEEASPSFSTTESAENKILGEGEIIGPQTSPCYWPCDWQIPQKERNR